MHREAHVRAWQILAIRAAGARNLEAHRATRTRDAQAFAERLRVVFEGFELRGLSQRQMVSELNVLGVKAPRSGCLAAEAGAEGAGAISTINAFAPSGPVRRRNGVDFVRD